MKTFDIILGKDNDGNFITFPGQENASLYAKSRSGKSSSFVAPNAFYFGGSLVVLDVRGEIFRATAGHRAERLGQSVYLLDPAGERSHCWNPLDGIDRNALDRWDQAARTANLLFPDAAATGGGGNTNADRFWEPAARTAYTAVTTMVAETPGEALHPGTVLRYFARGDGLDRLAKMISDSRIRGGHRYSQNVVDGISDLLGGDLPQIEGIRKTVATRLQAWFNPRIAAATRKSDFNLRDLRRRPMTIYVAVNPANMPRMRPYMALFFEQLVNQNVDVMPEEDATIQHQALVLLDEFAQLGRLDALANAAQFCAGYGLRIAYVIQNKSQLEARYGRAAALDIIDNTGCEIIFGTNDLATTEEISKRFGDTTTTAITKQRPRFWSAWKWDKQSEAEHLHRRPFMLPQEVARLRSDQQIILRAGMSPMVTQRQPWFKDPELSALKLPPPEIPRLEWSVPLDDGETQVVRKRARQIGGISEEDMEKEGAE